MFKDTFYDVLTNTSVENSEKLFHQRWTSTLSKYAITYKLKIHLKVQISA